MRLVARLVLGGALLGLVRTSPGPGEDGALVAANGNGRCNTPPCTCDTFGRLKCDCKDGSEELILTAEGERGLSRNTVRITVVDCPSVLLANQSLALMDNLVSIEFENVTNLTLVRHSFKLSGRAAKARVTLRNCSLDAMPSNVFHGDIEAILLENVRVGRLESFAFANLVNTNIITLQNCRVEAIDPFAFKKFDVTYLHIIGGSLGEQVPSRAMSDVEVYDKFMLEGVTMGTVRSSAFIVRKPKIVAILNCAIENLEGQAFDIAATGPVIIKNNTLGSVAFGAFLAIRADTEGRPQGSTVHQSLTFNNNSLKSFEEGSLIFDRTSFRTELTNVLVNQACDCEQFAVWKAQILNYTNVHSRLISFRDSSNIVAPPYSLESSAENPETFLCLEDPDSDAAVSFVEYESRHCAISGSTLLLILLLSGLLLIILLGGCVAIYCCRKRRREARKRWISVPTTAPDIVSKTKNGVIGREGNSATAGGPVDSRITMVVPDGRLYRETEFHVIVEKAEPLTTEL